MNGPPVDPWIAATPPGPAAHTPNACGRWQPLEEHLLQVAEAARVFADPFGAGEVAQWAGLLHDLGKYSPEFQQYLRACQRATLGLGPRPRPGSAPHKQAGAALASDRVLPALGFVILGHHGCIPSLAETKSELSKWSSVAPTLHHAAKADCSGLTHLPDFKPAFRTLAGSKTDAELLTRMVYSSLVDADSLDTEAHHDPTQAETRGRECPSPEVLRDRLRSSQSALIQAAVPSGLNALRREVYEACVRAASLPPGVLKLTVPTGGGKTRSSLAFALEHAVRHDLRRVIYAIPYTSIVDQTVEVFEEILGADAVLEHHSAIEPTELKDSEEAVSIEDLWRRLATQNWDAPLIVTTTVQLFESLFGNRPGRSRKVHNLSRAVIVLDEVQTLPPKLLKPIVDALRTLCDRFGTTVLLCTATQPALDRESLAQVGFEEVREIAPDPARLFGSLKRVDYDLSPLSGPDWSWERAAQEMRAVPACLAVVNARKDAIALLDALDDDNALHLSTLLCGRHRRQALAEIRRRLKHGEPCRVASTQVVECGCDLDFPRVLRAMGPLDRIVQAAGRCNREGNRSAEDSRVTVFRPQDGRAPRGSYQVAMGVADRLLHAGVDLHDPAVYESYFRQTYDLVDTDGRAIQKLRCDWDFPEVAHRMRLISEDTIGILVPYAPARDEIDALLASVRANGRMNRFLWRRVQPFLVSVPRWEFERFHRRGLVVEEVTDLWRWLGKYHEVRGLTEAEVDPCDLIL